MKPPADESSELRLSAEELARARALFAEFQEHEPAYSSLRLLDSYPDDSYRLAAKACKQFHVEMVLYEPVPTLHGVTRGDCILVSGFGTDSYDRRPFWTAGHEVSHMLHFRRPAEHAELTSYVMRDCVLESAFHERSQREKLARGLRTLFEERPVPDNWEEIVNEEIVADIAGNLWQDPEFWTHIYERDVNPSRRGVYTEIVARLEEEKPHRYRSWASDVVRVRERYVDYALNFLS